LMSGEIERLKKLIQKKESAIDDQMRMSGEWGGKLREAEERAEGMRRNMEEIMRELERFRNRNQDLLMMIVVLYSEVDRLRIVSAI